MSVAFVVLCVWDCQGALFMNTGQPLRFSGRSMLFLGRQDFVNDAGGDLC